MNILSSVWEWICNNKEWLFSGVGLIIITWLTNFLCDYRKEKKRIKEANDAVIKTNKALELKEEEFRLQSLPDLVVNGVYINQIDKFIKIEVINVGKNATLISLSDIPMVWKPIGNQFPYILHNGEQIILTLKYIGSGNINTDAIVINLNYKDIRGNKYISCIRGNSDGVKIVHTRYQR